MKTAPRLDAVRSDLVRAIRAKEALTNKHLAASVEDTIDRACACLQRDDVGNARMFADQALGMVGAK